MRNLCLLLLFFLVFTVSPSLADGPKSPTKTDRCPVCGMFVAPYRDWLSTLVFKDGSQLFFDGPKDLLRYYYSLPTKNDSRTRAEIVGIYVTDYYSTKVVPIEQVYLVLGSDVAGPMGQELIPVSGAEAAKTFARDHNGAQVIRFKQLTPQLLPAN